ncbi:Gfo/Idh/MocA family oxidoreductase [Variovorax sp. PCZ-1]|uniref:Gfo/Idh/MocA family protein n=1 Tax=Variovorax sp. PCZ-1 TaxID=2835533 RepID=UPI001BD02DA9|nr:Gfo/Idh/MocA family oxidoreductase [Variovorax sp. PCZ-1]MBS7806434.1 Gfo/Idh/MocA family oxidoreductase [Variovorax sp. PCZ-1]
MNRSKIAVAGAGYIGQVHMAALLSSRTLCLSAVVDPTEAGAQAAAKAGVPYYSSIEELLAQDRPDGIVLATPNQFHVPHAMQCLEAKLPMLLEKPIAPTVKEGLSLLQACEKMQGQILMGHHRAHSPIMAKACEVVQSGQLGRIVALQGSATFFKPDHYFAESPWRRELGGGPILLNMIHEVHNLRMLCGEISAVQAFKSHAVRRFAVEDTVAITLQFESGALGTFMLSDTAASAKSWEQTSQENKAYPSYSDEDCYTVSGTRGTLSVPTMRMKTYASDEGCSWWKPFEIGQASVQRDDPIKLQMEHFGAVVRGQAQPLVSAHDGLQNLRVTEAISLAAQSGTTITL